MTSMRERIAERLIARRHGECRVTDWQREAAENPNIADALADADAVLDALMVPTEGMNCTKEQSLHRRAQKAEGAVMSARHSLSVWKGTLAFHREHNRLQTYLADQIISDIERHLDRAAAKEGK